MPRKPTKWINHKDIRVLNDALHFASRIRRPLNTFISINPNYFDTIPGDIGNWVSAEFLNSLRIWTTRRVGAYHGQWVRENYEGESREHLHVLMHCPAGLRDDLETAIRRWYPGDEQAIDLGKAKTGTNWKTGNRQNFGFVYIVKQCLPQARYAMGGQVMRESRCRRTHAKVAPVLGKKWGISRSLDLRAQAAYWAKRGARTALAAMGTAVTPASSSITGPSPAPSVRTIAATPSHGPVLACGSRRRIALPAAARSRLPLSASGRRSASARLAAGGARRNERPLERPAERASLRRAA